MSSSIILAHWAQISELVSLIFKLALLLALGGVTSYIVIHLLRIWTAPDVPSRARVQRAR